MCTRKPFLSLELNAPSIRLRGSPKHQTSLADLKNMLECRHKAMDSGCPSGLNESEFSRTHRYPVLLRDHEVSSHTRQLTIRHEHYLTATIVLRHSTL